ncbi:MAG: hypothetical protein GX077_09700 [Tissierellia bacterium]|nr:hypothetical protein [Tissierellia bacterium]
MFKCRKEEAGLTIVEVILSLAIIGIIAAVFIPMFTMSAKANERSKAALDSTYVGQDVMELAYHLCKSVPFDESVGRLEEALGKELTKPERGYSKISDKEFRHKSGKQVIIDIGIKEGYEDLVRIYVEVYGKDKKQLEAQYESLYIWEGSGSSEGE